MVFLVLAPTVRPHLVAAQRFGTRYHIDLQAASDLLPSLTGRHSKRQYFRFCELLAQEFNRRAVSIRPYWLHNVAQEPGHNATSALRQFVDECLTILQRQNGFLLRSCNCHTLMGPRLWLHNISFRPATAVLPLIDALFAQAGHVIKPGSAFYLPASLQRRYIGKLIATGLFIQVK
jgi:hypothetical protein